MPPVLREKPGGSGMLLAERDVAGGGELSSAAQLGRGRGGRSCEEPIMSRVE